MDHERPRSADARRLHEACAREAAKRSVRASLIYAACGAVVTIATPFGHAHPLLNCGFVASLLLAGWLRSRIAVTFDKRYAEDPARACGHLTLSVAALALVWGLYVATVFMMVGLAPISMLMLLITSGMVAGGAHALAALPQARTAFLWTIGAPVILAAGLYSGALGPALAAVMTVYAVYVANDARGGAKAFEEALVGRMQREDAIREARAAAESTSAFLANMSHEIRTPMNGVLGMTELVLRTDLAPRQRRYLDTVRESGRLLLALLDDILDFSKLEANHVEILAEPFSLRDLVERTLRLFEPAASERGIVLRTQVHRSLPIALMGDDRRIRQVLSNLVGNAVKFTDRGEITVSVEGGAGAVRFVVRDTGIGISADRLAAIFDVFIQADVETQRDYGGTGLGLAICRRLVECMGGVLTVESEVGVGSAFTFMVPLEACTPPPGLAVWGGAFGDGSSDSPPPALQVLVAEDNAVNAIVIEEMLLAAGHTVELVDNGALASERVQETAYDVVLMDIQMPIMDGPAATREIRNRESADRRVPIIALTANVLPEDRELCRSAGMDGFVAKPVEAEPLLDEIHRVLAGRPDAPSN